MWCKHCNKEVENETCEFCSEVTQPDIPTEIYWCEHCKTPIIKEVNDIDKNGCPLCGNKTKYLAKDLRPVFPMERLLVEILMAKPLEWIDKTVWVCNNSYYIDGVKKNIPMSKFENQEVSPITYLLKKYEDLNSHETFNKSIKVFVDANRERLSTITNEAFSFIVQESKEYKFSQMIVSFSGGKDSTVVSDLVIRALANPSVIQVYGDTTLEFPMSYQYVERYRKDNPKAILRTAKNRDQNFYDVCEDIGPPARMMRWCCTMFKTGPITRILNSINKNDEILTFYGIRKSESVSRSKYDRVAEGSNVKIQKQKVASPIFYWSDFEIWLYILANEVDFNDAYTLGYDRVGCWCCPNNNKRAQFLSQIYMPEEFKKWRDYLISFASSIGKPDPVEYIDGGWWKARQGGNGVEASGDIKLKFTNCTAEDNSKIYSVNKEIDESFYNLFVPFGNVSKSLGNKLINEVLVVRGNVPIISIQPFNQNGYDYSVKIKTMNIKSHEDLQRKVSYQIRKYNACRKCLKCESICVHNAIYVSKNGYKIDEEKCKHCLKCVNPKYLQNGCLMDKFLKTKKED